MRKRLLKAFMLGALMSFSLCSLGAITETRWADEIVQNSTHSVCAVHDDVLLHLEGKIQVFNDVYISARKNNVTQVNHDVRVTVSKDNVTIKPLDLIGDPDTDWAHLIFHAELGSNIYVECHKDLIFDGQLGEYDMDMIVTFSGQGQVRFMLSDYNSTPDTTYSSRPRGAEVRFDGDGYGDVLGIDTKHRAGTKVYILMDQEKCQCVDNGINKVTFQRMSYEGTKIDIFEGDPCVPCDSCPETGTCYPYQGYPTGVVIGVASYITYLSTDAEGLGNTGEDGDYYNYANGGFGSLAFDPTHAGSGRMYLDIHGAYESRYAREEGAYPGNYLDGALIICGHFVPTFTEYDIRALAFLNATAGQKALFRVNDTLRFMQDKDDNDPDVAERKALLVLNRNTSIPQMASDPYSSSNLIGKYAGSNHPFLGGIALYLSTYLSYLNAPYNGANYYCFGKVSYNTEVNPYMPVNPYYENGPWTWNVRTGFILGVNGWMDVYHRTFIDYVALNRNENPDRINFADYLAAITGDYASTAWQNGSPYFKTRNPAALHIDGLNWYMNQNDFVIDQIGGEKGTRFTYYAAAVFNDTVEPGSEEENLHPTDARTIFYGDGRLYLRCAAYELDEPNGRISDYNNFGPWFLPKIDRECGCPDLVYTFSIGKYKYDNYDPLQNYDICTYIDNPLVDADEGNNVLDVEGRWKVYSLLRNDAPPHRNPGTLIDGHYDDGGLKVDGNYDDPTEEEMGIINLPPILIDHTGRELLTWDATSYITRPLDMGQTYEHYNSASMFFNLTPVDFYKVKIMHNDVLKYITANNLNAEPGVVGGEALTFNKSIYTGQMPLYDNGAYVTINLSSDQYMFEHFETPKLRFNNSWLDLHESLVSSGVRYLCRDLRRNLDTEKQEPCTLDSPYLTEKYVCSEDSNNKSIFTCYDHGDALDTLNTNYGRIFMAGCSRNLMDSGYPTIYTENTYVNVYRQNDLANGRYVDCTDPTPATEIELSLQSMYDDGVSYKSDLLDPIDRFKAHHLILFSRDDTPAFNAASYMSIGWTTTFGSDYYYPWETSLINGRGSDHFSITSPYVAEDGTVYPRSTEAPFDYVEAATVSVDGNYFYFGGTDINLNRSLIPVARDTQGSIVYTNHGGRFSVTQPTVDGEDVTAGHGYDIFFDTTLACRLWTIEGLCGIIDLPKDQVKYGHGYGRQPYDLSTTILGSTPGGIRLRAYNSDQAADYVNRIAKDRYSGEEYTIAWAKRGHDPKPYFIPVKAVNNKLTRKPATRYTALVNMPVVLPDHYLYFTEGDNITQLKVAGATLADPLHLLITGNATTPGRGWVREIVSIASQPGVHGEGAHAAIFLNNGGRVGLGSRDWDVNSDNAWNILGKDYVTICPMGNGVVDINSDVIVADPLAIVPEESFGDEESHRLTFRADDYKEIRVPAGTELDLSSLGYHSNQQQIEIGGRLRLVFEPGSTLRFPRASELSDNPAPVLYLNDQAQLIFEGDQERGKTRYTGLADADTDKIKIVGKGEIWVNKEAQIRIMDTAAVSIRSDEKTPQTDIIISLQREAQMLIGDDNESGGSLEVGNPTDLKLQEIEDPYVSFSLFLGGQLEYTSAPEFHLDRGGFLGFGVGIINKDGNPNADADPTLNPVDLGGGNLQWNPSENAWQVQTLYNVNAISIWVSSGKFYHTNSFDGSDRRASLMAIGPVEDVGEVDGSYTMVIRDRHVKSKVYGGGNIMRLTGEEQTALVNIWNYADQEEREDYTMYNLFPVGPIMLRANLDQTNYPNSQFNTVGNLLGGCSIVANQADFFKFISVPAYDAADYKNKEVTIGFTAFDTVATFVAYSSQNATGTNIGRLDNPEVAGGVIEDAKEQGWIGGNESNEFGPITFGLPEDSES